MAQEEMEDENEEEKQAKINLLKKKATEIEKLNPKKNKSPSSLNEITDLVICAYVCKIIYCMNGQTYTNSFWLFQFFIQDEEYLKKIKKRKKMSKKEREEEVTIIHYYLFLCIVIILHCYYFPLLFVYLFVYSHLKS